MTMIKVLASFIFFTRLPFWRLATVPAEVFKRAVDCWPLVGWLTGGCMALSLYLTSHIVPVQLAVILAVITRLLMTGALHEDGLADFFDGFGGGITRDRILSIMKDSHIGTYGVLSLILYFSLLVTTLSSLPIKQACLAILVGDTWCKTCTAQIINVLPYARKEEDAKAKVTYSRMSAFAFGLAILIGIVPAFCFFPYTNWSLLLVPVVVTALFIYYIKQKIGGYTGDCCGACFLLSELCFYLSVLICSQIS